MSYATPLSRQAISPDFLKILKAVLQRALQGIKLEVLHLQIKYVKHKRMCGKQCLSGSIVLRSLVEGETSFTLSFFKSLYHCCRCAMCLQSWLEIAVYDELFDTSGFLRHGFLGH